jgi:hypothetical protein
MSGRRAREARRAREGERQYDVLHALETHGRRVLREAGLKPDSCIAATRVGLEVLRYFGISAEELPVGMMVFNGPMLALMHRLQRLPTVAEIEAEPGAWSVGVGVKPPGLLEDNRTGGWDGHLVILTEPFADDVRWLIDLSVDQASRPQYGILMPECILAEATPGFLAGAQRLVGEGPNGMTITYEAHPENTDYRTAPDWHMAGQQPEVLTIIRTIERSL